jgi:hypothetical protein
MLSSSEAKDLRAFFRCKVAVIIWKVFDSVNVTGFWTA